VCRALFRTHLESAQASCHGVHAVVQPRQPKVGHLDAAVTIHQQVAALQVPAGATPSPCVHTMVSSTASLQQPLSVSMQAQQNTIDRHRGMRVRQSRAAGHPIVPY
jgi:hypothetical protein